MKKDFLKVVEALYDNNKKIIDKLIDEKRLLENVFLDNRLPEKLKDNLLDTYGNLIEVIEKRDTINKMLMRNKDENVNFGLLYNIKYEKDMEAAFKVIRDIANSRAVSIVCFTLDNLDLEKEYIKGTVIDAEGINEGVTSIPDIILNTGFFRNSKNINKIKQLTMVFNKTVVNLNNRFNQYIIFDIISAIPNSKAFLPRYESLSKESLDICFKDSNYLYLIPENGMIAKKGIVICKSTHSNKNSYTIDTENNPQVCAEDEIFKTIKLIVRNSKYMILKGSKLLEFNKYPLESRVYMQKGIDGKWSVTEIIAKNGIFTRESIYKDVAEVLDDVLISIKPDKLREIKESLINYSKNMCSYLDFHIANIGNCNFDFLITEEGLPLLFHFGGFENESYLNRISRKGIWEKYLSNSIDYLVYLRIENR